MTRVLVTCPPMLKAISEFGDAFASCGWDVQAPNVVQALSVEELVELVPQFDGWIIGDDPACKDVFEAGKAGSLRAAVKWGVGVDNVDFAAAASLGIPIINTPGMFGGEVADIALGYLIGLARETFRIDRAVRTGEWIKPAGISLEGKTAAVVGLGDIGRNIARRLLACGMNVTGYDPILPEESTPSGVLRKSWPEGAEQSQFLVLACALTPQNRGLVNASTLALFPRGLRLVNVSRGPLIVECDLEDALASGQVHSAALDVFEVEPLPMSSRLRDHDRCIFGTHNASNTSDAVRRTSYKAIDLLQGFLTK